jgi:hypothetical protein
MLHEHPTRLNSHRWPHRGHAVPIAGYNTVVPGQSQYAFSSRRAPGGIPKAVRDVVHVIHVVHVEPELRDNGTR